jgi:serine/threonine protein kinase
MKRDETPLSLADLDLSKGGISGTYGSSHIGTITSTHERVMVKFTPFAFFQIRQVSLLVQQFQDFQTFSHPALCPIRGVIAPERQAPLSFGVVSPLMPNGSLHDISTRPDFASKWTATRKMITIVGMAFGMRYLHSRNITHCFLKPSNVVFDAVFEPKIVDWWISAVIASDPQDIKTAWTRRPGAF